MKKAFTLIEILVSIAIVTILASAVVFVVRPAQKVEDSKVKQALIELKEIGKAIGFFASDNGFYPDDVSRGLPSGIEQYLTPGETWPDGPLPGSVYDYDNWSDQTCVDGAASGSVQITLREVPDRNPDGSDVWAWYYVLSGTGTAHCNSATEWDKGECINCGDFDPNTLPE
jgi:prepilin-type N-terminal cleavage/methylation domain-containing protein